MGNEGRWEVLTRIDCLRLLRSVAFGRVVFTLNALPVCQPVTFMLDGDRAMFRTTDGSGLDGSTRPGMIVALQADNAHLEDGSLWTVTVVGHCEPVTETAEIAALSALSPHDGAQISLLTFVAVTMDIFNGQRYAHRSAGTGLRLVDDRHRR